MRSPTAALVLFVAAGCTDRTADLLLVGTVYTLESDHPVAQAAGIADGRFICIDDCDDFRFARTVDLGSRTAVPGLTDAHMHLTGVGLREMELDLSGCASLDEMQAAIKREADGLDSGDWILGRGWIEARWDPPVFPTREDLDRVAPDNPVWLTRADGHGAVANSLALRVAGIDRETQDPAGGAILRDDAGRPTGMLLDRAKSLVERHAPQADEERTRRAMILGARRYAELGWTGASIAGISLDDLAVLRELVAAGEIPIRLYVAVSGPGPASERLLQDGVETAEGLLTVRGVKLFIDGALGSRGAALLAPYADAPDSSGLLVNDPAELQPLLEEALRRGVQIQTHAIGDRGNRIVLDLYEQAFAAVPPAERAVADPRWRIEHAQIVAPEDIRRFAELGVVASMQPSHAITDLHFAPSRLGPERLGGAYAWRSLLDAGARLAGGSDAPVEKGDPAVELYAAAVRRDLDGFADQDWRRDQRLTREQALRLFTEWAAYARFEEADLGSIAVGKKADVTVLSGDFFELPEQELPNLRAEMTIVGGQVVFER